MVDAEDVRLAAGDEAGQHERDAGAQVAAHHLSAFQLLAACYVRRVAFDARLQPHALQLRNVFEPVEVDRICNL